MKYAGLYDFEFCQFGIVMLKRRWPEVGEFLGRAGIAAYFSAAATLKGLSIVSHLSAWQTLPPENRLLTLLSDIASGIFLVFVIVLAMVRLQPLRTASGLRPRLYALSGTFLLIGLILVPSSDAAPAYATLVGLGLVLCGSVLSAWVLGWLGRSFSIVPEARKLVTNGPYGVVRHPLYITEGVATVGVVLLHWTFFAALLVCVQFLIQYRRIQLEEELLNETFPEYSDYAKRIPRLIPSIDLKRKFV
jgi:protein-S-isoprenylcysteine O-methyltransferase Ste14